MAQKKKRKKRRRIPWGRFPILKGRRIRAMIRTVLAETACYLTSTCEGYPGDGVHSPGSWHYRRKAADFGSARADDKPEKRAQKLLLDKFGVGAFEELFGPLDWYVKNGVKYPGTFPGHDDHLHVVARQL